MEAFSQERADSWARRGLRHEEQQQPPPRHVGRETTDEGIRVMVDAHMDALDKL